MRGLGFLGWREHLFFSARREVFLTRVVPSLAILWGLRAAHIVHGHWIVYENQSLEGTIVVSETRECVFLGVVR